MAEIVLSEYDSSVEMEKLLQIYVFILYKQFGWMPFETHLQTHKHTHRRRQIIQSVSNINLNSGNEVKQIQFD